MTTTTYNQQTRLVERIKTSEQRLHLLEIQAGAGGLFVDPKITIEIQEISSTLTQLKQQLTQLNTQLELLAELTTLLEQLPLSQDQQRQAYRACLAQITLVEEPDQLQAMITDLYERDPQYHLLIRFSALLAEQLEPTASRKKVETWFQQERVLQGWQLSTQVIDQQFVGQQPSNPNYLMIVVRPSKRQQHTYMVDFHLSHVGLYESLDDIRFEDLEDQIYRQLDDILAIYDTLDAIECYVPETLLRLGIDQWEFSHRKLIGYSKIMFGVLPRHEALFLKERLERLPKEQQIRELTELKRDQFMRDLVRACRFWLDKWASLASLSDDQLAAMVMFASRDDIRQTAMFYQDTTICTFNFVVNQHDQADLREVLLNPLIAGMPVIVWTNQSQHNSQVAPDPTPLQAQFQSGSLRTINDVVERIHLIRREALQLDDPDHYGHYLTFILDNPERRIFQLERKPL